MKTIIDLGTQPIANGFVEKEACSSEFFYSLKMHKDPDTGLLTQGSGALRPSLMFNDDYSYRASMSATMRLHFSELSKSLQTNKDIKILEIGSNDGVFIKNWGTQNAISVEPCGNFAKETQAMGYKTYNDFWSEDLGEKILAAHGPQDIVFSANCMCHIPDLDSAFKAVKSLLSDHGIFIFEDPSLAEMVNNTSYDQIYDEHLHIFSITSLDKILKRNGMEIVKVENLNVHGGSNRVFAKKSGAIPDNSVEDNKSYEKICGATDGLHSFSFKVKESKKNLLNILKNCKEEGKKVISYGATSKSTTVFNYCGIDANLIDYITDTTPEKQNKFSPGKHIPIVKPSGVIDKSVDYVFLGAWNFLEEIQKKEHKFISRGGRFITHIPCARII